MSQQEQMTDLMLDIETMGVRPTSVVLQVGACYFNRRTGAIGETFCENVLQEAEKRWGFTCDLSTIAWWQKQDPAVRAEIAANALPSSEVFERFRRFAIPAVTDALPIWSHATFDFPIVSNHLAVLDIPRLPYMQARDIRTLTELSGINLKKYDWKQKRHNALDDCLFQVKYCVDAFRLLTVREGVG